jgi:hypothetical protein
MGMKKSFITYLLVFQFLLPIFAPWLPDGSLHAIHDQHQSHHADSAYVGNLDRQDRSKGGYKHLPHKSIHHPANIVAVTDFRDYLHADLRTPAPVAFVTPAQESQNFDFEPAFGLLTQQRLELASNKIHAPPNWLNPKPSHTPLYLSTQRFRI